MLVNEHVYGARTHIALEISKIYTCSGEKRLAQVKSFEDFLKKLEKNTVVYPGYDACDQQLLAFIYNGKAEGLVIDALAHHCYDLAKLLIKYGVVANSEAMLKKAIECNNEDILKSVMKVSSTEMIQALLKPKIKTRAIIGSYQTLAKCLGMRAVREMKAVNIDSISPAYEKQAKKVANKHVRFAELVTTVLAKKVDFKDTCPHSSKVVLVKSK